MTKSIIQKYLPVTALTFFTLLSSSFAVGSEKGHWQYAGPQGPEKWGALDTAFATCASGKNQSPINLTRMIDADLPALKLDYQAGGYQVVNNGHTIQVNYRPQSAMSLTEQQFELKQFHFHSPSENIIEGQSFPLEAHFVHADANGQLAVIAVMFEEGKANLELEKIWSQMPVRVNDNVGLTANISAQTLIGDKLDYYRFNGSLTTPPCSEGVNWFVIKAPNSISAEQVKKFNQVMKHHNNRPVQPINARIIIQ